MKLYALNVNRVPQVSFSWKLDGTAGQKSYHLVVKDDDQQLFWDSGVVFSSKRHNIPCEKELQPHHIYTWSVTVTDTAEEVQEAAGEPFFSGIYEWQASWLEPDRTRKPLTDKTTPTHGVIEQKDPLTILDPAVCMRKTFSLDKLPEKALLYASARGIYTLCINGKRVSDLFAPGVTSYARRIEYQCYDVAPCLTQGENVISAVLADGWFTGKIGAVGIGMQYGTENALIFQLDLKQDGQWRSICSDDTVKFADSAWKYADLFIGSGYEEASEQKGWESPGFDDSDWKNAVVKNYSYEQLSLQTIAPIREARSIRPAVLQAPNGDLLLDAGETIVGYVSFRLHLKKGDVVTLEHTEVLDAEGNYMVNIVGQNKNQTDTFWCNTDGLHEWTPEFTWHGFRYVRVKGVPVIDPEAFEIHVIHTPMARTGSFRCSDERLNRLQENILRSQEGNMIGIPTDCPQREKTGWTGDMQVYAPTACYEMDVENFVRHWLQDMENEQLPDGQIPHIIPYIPSHDIMKPAWIDGVSAAGWSDACVIVPWRLYEFYGDKQILKDNYRMMDRYMASLKARVAAQPADCESTGEHMQYIWNNDFQYGDWLMPSAVKSGLQGPAMMKLTGFEAATLMYVYTNRLMERICRVLEKPEEAEEYKETAQKTCDAFLKEFGNEDGTLKKDFQGLYVLALAMEAIPESKRDNAVNRLAELVHSNGDCLDTGFLSIPFLLPVLHDNGQADLANTLLFQEKSPSWLYEVACGATTLWESWDAIDENGNPKDYSMNHFAFGCVGEYLFKYIAGIRNAGTAFDRVRIEPDFRCGLSFVDAEYDSIYGKIAVNWDLSGDKKEITIILPPDVQGMAVIEGKEYPLKSGPFCLEW